LLVVLGAALFAAMFEVVVGDGSTPTILLVLAIGAVATVGLATRPVREIPVLCDPLVLSTVFLMQFFAIGPLAMEFLDFHVHIALSDRQRWTTLAAFLALYSMLVVGYNLRVGAVIAEILPVFETGYRRVPARWAEWSLIGASVLGVLWYLQQKGGLGALISVGYQGKGNSSFFLIAFHMMMSATLLMFWRLVDQPKTSALERLIFYVFLAWEILFFAVVLGARKRLLYLFFALLAIYVLRRGVRRLPKVRLAALTAVLLVFFALWGSVRSRPLDELVSGSASPVYRTESEYHMGYFKSVAEPFTIATMSMEIFPRLEPFKHGRTLLVTVLGFIPRAIWPDKPIGLGKELTRYTDGVFYSLDSGHSVTPTLLGDFYVNFGWFGIFIGGLLFGLALRVISEYAVRGMRNGLQLSAIRCLLPAILLAGLIEVREDVATMLAFYVLVTIPMLPALVLCRLDAQDEAPGRDTSPLTAADDGAPADFSRPLA
jgi:hypothetical protein